ELADHPLRGIEELDGALDLDSFRGFAQATVARGRILRLHVALSGLAAIPGHPAEAYFARHYHEAVREFTSIIATWQSAGLADPRLDCAVAARQVLATWDGLKLQWLVAPGFDVGEALVDAIRRLTGRDAMETQHAVLTALMQGQA
ncbi:MAG: hypothetical protein HGA44_14360, partial [Cellulomonadaceae bacterium]|nr:hypothetical protein [Cellulomonadaceae bacterium]